MNKITNPKIGFKRFSGFSLLFDNPLEKDFSPIGNKGDLYKINLGFSDVPKLNFYNSIRTAMEDISLQIDNEDYFLFKLPSYSYHVTVWDGLNESNKEMIFQSYKPILEDFLFNLPRSMTQNYRFTEIALSSPLVKNRWNIRFKFSKLSIFGRSVLVALLKPADDYSKGEFEKIKSLRTELYKKFKAEFGLANWIDNFKPHVSLAYFGNEGLCDIVNLKKNQLNKIITDNIKNSHIEFSSISLYGFIDMVTFFKFKQPVVTSQINMKKKVMI